MLGGVKFIKNDFSYFNLLLSKFEDISFLDGIPLGNDEST